MLTARQRRTLAYADPARCARFDSHVDRSGGPDACWPWLGYRCWGGYGSVRVSATDGPGSRVATHVFAYERANGPLPAGHQVHHTCHDYRVCPGGRGDPHRACCNPTHLAAVPDDVNRAASNSPAATNGRKQQCLRGHPLRGGTW